jgi:tetratricopeptide (TPR) repeat protein
MRFLNTFLFLFFSVSVSFAQNEAKLAQYYYQSGEYEKSASLYKKLSDQQGFNDYYFNKYIESLMAVEFFDEAKLAIKSQLQKMPQAVQLYVSLGNIFERQAEIDKANETYKTAIARLPPNRGLINSLGNSFVQLNKFEMALQVYEKGTALLKDETLFAYNLSDLYRRKGDNERMIHYFLQSQMSDINRIASAQNHFSRYLHGSEDYEILRSKLYEFLQKDPDNLFFPEMIQWVFIQNKEYSKALRQARALDMRLGENGNRVFNMAQIAGNDEDFDTAIDAYSYIIETKGPSNGYYIDSKKELLNTKRKKIIQNSQYSREELEDLKLEYVKFLDEFGRDNRTALIIKELADLEALYLGNIDDAINILSHLVELNGLNKYIKANAKLSLADYYLINGEVWESSLLYSQVDKEFREGFLGENARFKNAKLSYYNGDFEWAQEQFDILKSSTSKLISNDAIELSVFIMDNANLDTTYAPLLLYAQAELLVFQNKFEEAKLKLDEVVEKFPMHSLEDDVLFAKAQIDKKLKHFDSAVAYFSQIIEKHKDEIRCDNAIYELAQLYETEFNDVEKAKELYQKLFIDYSDSTFAIDARKKYRMLRGDQIQ